MSEEVTLAWGQCGKRMRAEGGAQTLGRAPGNGPGAPMSLRIRDFLTAAWHLCPRTSGPPFPNSASTETQTNGGESGWEGWPRGWGWQEREWWKESLLEWELWNEPLEKQDGISIRFLLKRMRVSAWLSWSRGGECRTSRTPACLCSSHTDALLAASEMTFKWENTGVQLSEGPVSHR